MATFDLGRVTPIYKGDYSASASYELNDVVLYNGNLYWHVQSTATVGILPTDTTVWKLAFADEGIREEIRGYADNAQNSANSAQANRSAAATSASQASASASQAASSAQTAQTAETVATASAQTASTKASEATASAQSAASSAQTATDKATLATNKAQAASESATLATAKANAAATSETNATTAAQTATTKASEAAASATSAQEYDESAQQSAVNAQTAQGLAESAGEDAVSAKDEAQSIVDGIRGKVEQIDSNTERIESLEDDCYKPYVVDTVSGAIASFSDGADGIPLKSLVVNINPVQDLSNGDPSPENICPISGWTGCEVNHSGADTSDPTTIPITFPAEAGTVYGGKLDVLSGVLTVDRNMVDLGTLNYTQGSSAVSFYAILPNDEKIFGNHELPNWICTKYPIVIGNSFSNVTVGIASINLGKMYVKDPAFNGLTASQVQTAMSGVQLVYELATPQTHQLTPTEIRSLLGTNNIWANTGDTTVEYRADTSAYVAKKIAEAISALS